jgi:phosphatidate cytidylyltransferase
MVSPGKSWAGFFGGAAAVAVFAVIVGLFLNVLGLTYLQLVLVTVVTGISSVLGDLLESMIKRERGLKDSSQLLPGHGGVMDRIDSLTAAAPVFVLLAVLLTDKF